MRRLAIIIALLVIIPIIELAVLIAVGQVIGAGWTILLVLATSVLGGWLLRHEGWRAWRAFQNDLAADRPPGPAATNGLLVLLGGVFMLVPGFVSDVVGLLLIAPPTRRLAAVVVMRAFASRLSPTAATSLFGPRRVRARAGQPRRSATAPDYPPGRPARASDEDRNRSGQPGETIEGEIVDP